MKTKIQPGDVVSTPKGAGVVKSISTFMVCVLISNRKHRFALVSVTKI